MVPRTLHQAQCGLACTLSSTSVHRREVDNSKRRVSAARRPEPLPGVVLRLEGLMTPSSRGSCGAVVTLACRPSDGVVYEIKARSKPVACCVVVSSRAVPCTANAALFTSRPRSSSAVRPDEIDDCDEVSSAPEPAAMGAVRSSRRRRRTWAEGTRRREGLSYARPSRGVCGGRPVVEAVEVAAVVAGGGRGRTALTQGVRPDRPRYMTGAAVCEAGEWRRGGVRVRECEGREGRVMALEGG